MVLLLAAFMPRASYADCAKDLNGEVFCGAGRCALAQGGRVRCSRFDDGDAQRTRKGEVLCSRGECAKTFDGRIYCSSVEGGAVLKDSRGRVRCEGRCEPAAPEYCESTIAGSAE